MFKKLSNIQLFSILIVLLIIIAGIKWWDNKKGERNFRKELSAVDSTAIKSIYIYPKLSSDNAYTLYYDQKDERWEVEINKDFGVPADLQKVNMLLSDLSQLKPERVVANTSDFWKDYRVDSSGNKILVISKKDRRALELIVGKPVFKNQRQLHSYLRIQGEKEIYEADSKLSLLITEDKNAFRKRTLFSTDPENWQSLKYRLPAFGDYEVEKKDKQWWIEDTPLDSAKANQRIQQIASANAVVFNDELQASALKNPDFKLFVSSPGGTDTLLAYARENKVWLTSSANPINVIDAKASGIFEKIFIGKAVWENDSSSSE